jgi:NACalpha-BTF3-like transcription factor
MQETSLVDLIVTQEEVAPVLNPVITRSYGLSCGGWMIDLCARNMEITSPSAFEAALAAQDTNNSMSVVSSDESQATKRRHSEDDVQLVASSAEASTSTRRNTKAPKPLRGSKKERELNDQTVRRLEAHNRFLQRKVANLEALCGEIQGLVGDGHKNISHCQ